MIVDNGEPEEAAKSTDAVEPSVVKDVAAAAPADEVDRAVVANDVGQVAAAEPSKVAEVSAKPTEVVPKPVVKADPVPVEKPEEPEVPVETPAVPEPVAPAAPVIEAPAAVIVPAPVPAVIVSEPEAPVVVPEPAAVDAPIQPPAVVEEKPVAQPEPVSVEQPKAAVISKNGEIAPEIVISPVEPAPITIDGTTKLDIVTSKFTINP